MVKPSTLTIRPWTLLAALGGAVAVLCLSALIYLAPVFGLPFLDFPHLIGGIFTEAPEAAFWLGYAIFFIVGVFVFAPLLAIAWPSLPGDDIAFTGALVKGIVWGVILWILGGLLLPVFGWLNQLEPLANAGFFAFEFGILGAIALLLGHLVYGIAVALVAAMGRGIVPIDYTGWLGHGAGHEAQGIVERPTAP